MMETAGFWQLCVVVLDSHYLLNLVIFHARQTPGLLCTRFPSEKKKIFLKKRTQTQNKGPVLAA